MMARMPRLFVEGCPQHIIQRGNNRSACFFCDADYAFYLQKLNDAARKNNVKVHAFVLMTNHVHLLVSGQNEHGIPNMMQALGRSFVRYINIMYQRTGTLWEGRYKSSIVSTGQYFLAVSRYIELNPIRTKMAALPGEYPWSSYRHNGIGITSKLISEHVEYKSLGSTKSIRLQAYRKLFGNELSVELLGEIRLCTNKGWVIGNEKFKQEIESALKRKVSNLDWGGDRRSEEFRNQVT